MKLGFVPARFVAIAMLAALAACATGEELTGSFDEGLAAYEQGDHRAAYFIWRSASTAGDRRAAFRIGDLYDFGTGIDQDYGMAAAYYLRAAEFGHAEAQFRLAGRYEDGVGVSRNRLQALIWYLIAIENKELSIRNRELAELHVRTFTSTCAVESDYCKELHAEARRKAAAWQAQAR